MAFQPTAALDLVRGTCGRLAMLAAPAAAAVASNGTTILVAGAGERPGAPASTTLSYLLPLQVQCPMPALAEDIVYVVWEVWPGVPDAEAVCGEGVSFGGRRQLSSILRRRVPPQQTWLARTRALTSAACTQDSLAELPLMQKGARQSPLPATASRPRPRHRPRGHQRLARALPRRRRVEEPQVCLPACLWACRRSSFGCRLCMPQSRKVSQDAPCSPSLPRSRRQQHYGWSRAMAPPARANNVCGSPAQQPPP